MVPQERKVGKRWLILVAAAVVTGVTEVGVAVGAIPLGVGEVLRAVRVSVLGL